jgi:probable rRNA maturation factor
LTIRNPEKDHRIDLLDTPNEIPEADIKAMIRQLLDHLRDYPVELSIAFVDDDRMRSLNKQYRGMDSATDVLSFPIDEPSPEGIHYLGDIVIAVGVAREQALEFSHDLKTEVLQLVAHGILHLCGFDHETDDGIMNELELKLREGIVQRYCR